MDYTIRPARSSDKEPLMSFIRGVWGGHDYIPKVWDDWMADRGATMFVLETEGTPVAMNRVRALEDGSVWVEGVRVHPSYRRMGLASALGKNAIDFAKAGGATTLRLTTSSMNRASQAQIDRMGFRETGRFSIYETSKERRFRQHHGVQEATEGDLRTVRAAIEGTADFKRGGGFLWNGFVAVSLVPEVIKSLIGKRSVFLAGRAVAIRVVGGEGADVWNQIGFLSGNEAEAWRLVSHIFSLKGKFDWRFVTLRQGSPLVRALRTHGFQRSFSNILFERRAIND